MNQTQKATVGKMLLGIYALLGIVIIVWVVSLFTSDASTDEVPLEVLDLGVVPLLAGPGQRMTTNVLLEGVEEEVSVKLPESVGETGVLLVYYPKTAPESADHAIVTTAGELTIEQEYKLMAFLANTLPQEHGFLIDELVDVTLDKTTIVMQGMDLDDTEKTELEEALGIEIKTELE